MQLKTKTKCQWMMGCWCCGLRASSVLICCVYLLIHTAFLVTNFVLLGDPQHHVDSIIKFIDTNDSRLQNSILYSRVRPYIVRNTGEYLALPITMNLVLMVGNMVAAWGALASTSLLLLPWLLLYLVCALFVAALLIYVMFLLQDLWFRVLVFLVVSPLLVFHSACWIMVCRLYRAIRSSMKVPTKSMHPSLPTMYTPEPHTWDQPLPIWAVSPPQTTWDPEYLQQLDPRYAERSSRSRRSSSRSRSQSGRSPSQPSSGYHHSDSVSLSDKYGERRAQDNMSDRYETEDQSEYRTDGEETVVPGEETEEGEEMVTEEEEDEETEEDEREGDEEDEDRDIFLQTQEEDSEYRVSGSDRWQSRNLPSTRIQ